LNKKPGSRRAAKTAARSARARRANRVSPRRRRRLRVGVIYGGRSVEHEVSLVSARAIMRALDPERYEVVPIGISRTGRWALGGTHYALPGDPSIRGLIEVGKGGRSGKPKRTHGRPRTVKSAPESRLDVVFPVVHGTGGEDGSLQGLLTLAGIPFVGSGVLGSAVGMDKVAMKALFQHAGLPIVDYRTVRARDIEGDLRGEAASLEEAIGYPCFVKPANGGSSVGVSKAVDRASLMVGLRLAVRYDRKVVVERGVDAREIECSVLGNDRPEASVPGEIIPANEFYDYRAKYIDAGSRIEIPAAIGDQQRERVQELAVRAFEVLDLAGMARVDFFLCRASGEVYLNEVNTIPGFTSISMYAKLWEASGVPFAELVDRLIELALESHAERTALITTYDGRRNGGSQRS
jgi:D-alanine-D-alanine ligase